MRVDPQHKKWVEGFAARAHRRLFAAGCRTLQRDDVVQECWIAWCKARDTFDPAAGASFGTYLYRGMELHIRGLARDLVGPAQATAMGEDAMSAAEAKVDIGTDQERSLGIRQARAQVLGRMSRITRQVVEMVEAPPAWVVEEFRAMRAKVAWCRQRGFTSFGPHDIGIPFIFQALGLDPAAQRQVQSELRAFVRLTV